MNMQIQFTSLKDVRRANKKKGPKLIINIIVTIFLVVNLAGLYAGNDFYKKTFNIDTKKNIDQFETSKAYFNEKRYSSLQKEEVSVTPTQNNYKLYGTYIKNPKASKDTVILLHGLSGSRWTVLKYADMYLDRGFNILIYDGRNHGESGGTDVTYGFDEKYDLDRWVNWLYTKNKGGIIGVHGESMGAATALLHSQLNESKKKVSFYIADSSYSNLKDLLRNKAKEVYNIKSNLTANTLLFYADKVNKLKNQFNFDEVSINNIVKEVSIPILFIHGEDDSVLPKTIAEDLYNAKQGPKELYISKSSGHEQAFVNNSEEYKENIYKFLDSYINTNK
jgi:fermentation-respiration switch protein FrsA (DUF1100 family)